jgi:cell division septation protein DedD
MTPRRIAPRRTGPGPSRASPARPPPNAAPTWSSVPASRSSTRPAASAASASRQAITDLLRTGESRIEADQIFAAFPRYVAAGGELLPLPAWHEGALRDLCSGELFPRWQTRATQLLLTAALPRPAGPPEGYPARRMH